MAILNQIQLSQLEDDLRFDAQYYSPQNMIFEEEIKRFPSIKLGSIALITDGQHGYFIIDKKSDIRQITAKCITGGLIDKTGADRLSPITHMRNLRSSLQPGDVLITTAGTIGEIGIVTDDIPPANIDQDIGRIAMHSDIVSQFFVWAFLQSKFGRFQIERFTTGQVQSHLSLKKMRNLRIPILERYDEINSIILKFIAKKNESKTSYIEANRLLETELALERINLHKPVGYTARLSEVVSNNRADADYYNVRYRELRDYIRSYHKGYQRFLDCAKPIKPNFNPCTLPNKHFRYIELADINSSLGVITKANKFSGKALPSRARRRVSEGDLIASSVVGSVDKSALIEEAYDNCIASTGFFHFRPVNVSPQYLLILLRSRLVTMQLQQEATGGILSAVPDSRLRNIIIPRIPKEIQLSIEHLVIRAHEANRESEKLLDQAIIRVEQMIEEAVQNETLA